MKSEHVKIGRVERDITRIYQLFDDFVFDIRLDKKNELHLRLLTEEVLRLAKQIVGDNTVDFWFEGDARLAYIFLTATNSIDENKRQELLSVSSSGENSMEQGFFSKLASMFVIEPPAEKKWSLKEYQAELLKKREEDKYSQEAWDDLERSLVANLADDIEVGFDKDIVKMIVTKDFSEALSNVNSRVPAIISKQIIVDSDVIKASNAIGRADSTIEELKLNKKDSFHLNLIFEETLGMLKEMTGEYSAVIWFEKYKNQCCIRLTAKTEMDINKKKNLLDMSFDGTNSLVKGFMGKVRDVIENGALGYNNVMKLQQEYGGGYVQYGTMGMYSSTEGMADTGIMWSLCEYRSSLSDEMENVSVKEAWDELEKSIVAKLAKDVVVGVKGDRVDMTIVYDIEQ